MSSNEIIRLIGEWKSIYKGLSGKGYKVTEVKKIVEKLSYLVGLC